MNHEQLICSGTRRN